MNLSNKSQALEDAARGILEDMVTVLLEDQTGRQFEMALQVLIK